MQPFHLILPFNTVLSEANVGGHEAVVRLLLATCKVDVDSRDNNSRTPLSKATKRGYEVIVRLLLATNKVDVDSRDKDGYTPLSNAVQGRH